MPAAKHPERPEAGTASRSEALAALAIQEARFGHYWSGTYTYAPRSREPWVWPKDENGNLADEIRTYGGTCYTLTERSEWEAQVRKPIASSRSRGRPQKEWSQAEIVFYDRMADAYQKDRDAGHLPVDLVWIARRITAVFPEFAGKVLASNGTMSPGLKAALARKQARDRTAALARKRG
jgi:hypothetical protein